MPDSFVHETAVIRNSGYSTIKVYRNAYIVDSSIGGACSIGDDTTIERCTFENNITINRRSYINDSKIGAFTYTGINTTINWAEIGRFCSFARNVDVGGFDYDYHKITTMPAFRFAQAQNGGGQIPVKLEHDLCKIGNDVWIAAGAQVLHKVTVGDGAVIGGGAVVTHDVPPYAIVAGVPARIIGYRCDKRFIDELLEIKWWNWPMEKIVRYSEMLIQTDINEYALAKMKEISAE